MRSIVEMVALKKAGCLKEETENSLVFHRLRSLLARASLFGKENSVDVGEDTTLGNSDSSQQLVQLFVVTDGQLKMAWVYPLFLVVSGSVASQLKDLSSEVLHDGSQIDWGTSTYSLRVVAGLEKTVNTTHGKLESCAGRSALGLGASFASFATSRHDDTNG